MARSDATVDKVIHDVARKATRQGKYDSRVDTAVSYVNKADATVPEVTHLNTAMNTCLMHDCMALVISMVYQTVWATMG